MKPYCCHPDYAYDWEKWSDSNFLDYIIERHAESYDRIISEEAKKWSESRKLKNQLIGKDRAQQEISFREEIISEKSEKLGNTGKFFWITVNPVKDTPFQKLKSKIELMVKHKWIEAYTYVYENTENNHIHSHVLLKADYEPARVHKECARSVATICNTANTSCFKFVILDLELAKQKYSYMMGIKTSKKEKSMEICKKWREDNNIKPYYQSESLILLDSGKVLSTPDSPSPIPDDGGADSVCR